TYLALTFGTLLSSQGTDASFKSLSGPSGLFPSVLRFQPYQMFSRPFPDFDFHQVADWIDLLPFG
ncbi:hypothetical protein, partial [Streptomyces sp. NPDC048057]|uniref:hypothetical protein n=1 Tax=Streptomyces sp. NPDC048057 TaxID=3155628 RepID=UPI0033DEA256